MESYAKFIVYLREQKLEFILSQENMTIGRGTNQSIVLREPTISRLHARIFIRDSSYFLEDLSTFQKTYLNKETIQIPKNLKHKDIVQLGNVKGLFLLSSLKPEEESILEEIQYTFKGDYDASENHTEDAPFEEKIPIQAEVSDVFVSVEEVLENKQQIEIEDAPLSVGESLNMPLSEIPFANPVTYADKEQTDAIKEQVNEIKEKTRILDAQILCENTKQMLAVTKEALYVGFDSINEMQITDPYFSKVHFAIMFNKKSLKYYLKNMGDKEVRCDGLPIENMKELSNYSIISSGKYRFHFFSGFEEVAELQQTIMREYKNESFPMRFFPELPSETVILDSSVLQLKGEYKILGEKTALHSTIFFSKDVESSKYIFLGEIYGDKDDLPSSTVDPYLIKIQGIFETILEYQTLPNKIIEDFNKAVYSKFKGISINGTLVMLHRDEVIWIGDGLCAPICYNDKKCTIKPSKGMSLGKYGKFLGKEERVSWAIDDKILFFSNSILNCNLKAQNALISVDSLKLLFSSKLNNTGFSLSQFTDDLSSKIDVEQQLIFTLISRQNIG